ncbi:MAG: sodium:proton antiporter [Phycisphaerae bacterium]
MLLVALADSGSTAHPIWIAPFVALLLCIALLPLLRRTAHWWEHNRNKLLVSLALAGVTLAYTATRGPGEGGLSGLSAVLHLLEHAILGEYVPFLALLLSLYVVAGGLSLRGDIPATPAANTTLLAIGGLVASLIGTTGAAMVLIRPLLRINRERKHVAHTVIFFIFIVCNVGGSLLPLGDPPLFLGYLRGVPYFWTLALWPGWALMLGALLAVYWAWDVLAHRRELTRDIERDETEIIPLSLIGGVNFAWLAVIVLATALVDPSRPIIGTGWTPPPYLREGIQLAAAGLSLLTTPRAARADNDFNYVAIGEVACLFLGIFVTMQTPIELLHAAGPALARAGYTHPWQFFWASGMLSSFLDNAPTYVVFFETACRIAPPEGAVLVALTDGDLVRADHLVAISYGAVFMGANTYIGNGPNFMVRSIAEQAGVRMPSFFGFMAYSGLILIPLLLVITFALL